MTKIFVALGLFATFWPAAPLCAQSFSSGKNLHELQHVYAGTLFRQPLRQVEPERSSGVHGLPRTFLPKWTPDALPLFCKIEHRMGRRMAVPLKFRLGSVEYVDRLEYPGRWGVD